MRLCEYIQRRRARAYWSQPKEPERGYSRDIQDQIKKIGDMLREALKGRFLEDANRQAFQRSPIMIKPRGYSPGLTLSFNGETIQLPESFKLEPEPDPVPYIPDPATFVLHTERPVEIPIHVNARITYAKP